MSLSNSSATKGNNVLPHPSDIMKHEFVNDNSDRLIDHASLARSSLSTHILTITATPTRLSSTIFPQFPGPLALLDLRLHGCVWSFLAMITLRDNDQDGSSLGRCEMKGVMVQHIGSRSGRPVLIVFE